MAELLAPADVERFRTLLAELGKSLSLDVDRLGTKELAAAVASACPIAANPLDLPPRNPLGPDPRVECEADIDRALEEMAYNRSRAETAQAACDAICRSAKSLLLQKLTLTIEGKQVAIVDRNDALNKSIADYATTKKHRAALLAGGGKSRAFSFGTLSWKNRATSIEMLPGLKEKDALARIEKQTGIMARISDLLLERSKLGPEPEEGSKESRKLDNSTFLRVTYAINFQAIKSAFLGDRLTKTELRSLGYRPTGNAEDFRVDVGEYRLTSESTAK